MARFCVKKVLRGTEGAIDAFSGPLFSTFPDPKKKFDIQSFVSDRSGMVSNISPKDQISQWVIDKSSSALKEVTYPADATERENAEAEAVYDADSETDIDGDTADS